MSFIAAAPAVLSCVTITTSAMGNGSQHEPLLPVTTEPDPGSAALTDSDKIAWVRAMHDDGWIFSFKTTSYRNGRVVPGDVLELDDYALCRPDLGRTDDTDQLIAVMRLHDRWSGIKAAQRTTDPVLAAIDEHANASRESAASLDQLESGMFAACDLLGQPTSKNDREWFRRAGLSQLRAAHEKASSRYVRSWKALQSSVPVTIAGAAALIRFVIAEADEGLDVEKAHLSMLKNALLVLADRPV